MKLIKLSEEHYIVVDDSEIKEGDWIGFPNLKKFVPVQYLGGDLTGGEKKITHSTQPLEWFGGEIIFLSEVKELLGVVDVEKSMWYERNLQNPYPSDSPSNTGFNKGFELGYNQALEDNKEKKYTEEDLMKFYKYVKTHTVTEALRHIQPQTEWEVEIVDGKLKLK